MSRTIRDPRGRPLSLDFLIGRGTFGEVWAITPQDGGPALTGKLPIAQDSLTELDPKHRGPVADICSRMVRDQGRLLERLPEALRPQVLGVVDGGGAVPCLLMENLGPSMAQSLASDVHFIDLLDLMAAAARGLQPLHDAGAVHGNLGPGNIFIDADGNTRFTDPASERASALRDAIEMLPGWHARLPPEVLNHLEGLAPLDTPAVDTFALGKIFYQAVVSPESVSDPRQMDGLFIGPLDKLRIKPFMAALEKRFESDRGNPHTRELFLRRTQSLITRLLSEETAPSPPFRFYRGLDLAARLEELKGLFHPGFEQMGPIVLDRPTGNEVFTAGEEVRFSLAFKCQGGLTNPDLLNCFVYVRDLDREQKVSGLEQEVLPVHDGTRFRCEFRLRGLNPGRYLLRVGMGVKGTPGKPIPRDALLAVQDAPPPPPRKIKKPLTAPAPIATAKPAKTQSQGAAVPQKRTSPAANRAGSIANKPVKKQKQARPTVSREAPPKAADELKQQPQAPAPQPQNVAKPAKQAEATPEESFYNQARGSSSTPAPGAAPPGGLVGGLKDRTFVIAAAVVFVLTVTLVLWLTR